VRINMYFYIIPAKSYFLAELKKHKNTFSL
jgi:hypothetical protein